MNRLLLATLFACGMMLGAVAGGFAQQPGTTTPPSTTPTGPAATQSGGTQPGTTTTPPSTTPPGPATTKKKEASDTTNGEKKELTKQQKKMKDCSREAKAKGFKGDQRNQFMSTCLKSE